MAAVTVPPICPYCRAHAEFLPSSAQLYGGHEYGPVWACVPCNAWVGCHRGTDKPLGRLAGAHLRYLKREFHRHFDPLWIRRYERKHAIDPAYTKAHAKGGRYRRLAELMGIPKWECHVMRFDEERCRLAIEILKSGALDERNEERNAA